MTHHVIFSASQTALWNVKHSLASFPPDDNGTYNYLAIGTSCILSCSMAFESLVNEVFLDENIISHWDEFKLASKADVLFELKGKKIDWSINPFQRVSKLIKVRNWLTHHKEPYLGLTGLDLYWVHSENKPKSPKVDILRELKKSSIQKYYDAVRKGGIEIATIWDYKDNLDWLTTEKYEPLTIL